MRRVRSFRPMTTLLEWGADEASSICRVHRWHGHPTHREPSVAEQPAWREQGRARERCKSPQAPCVRLYCLLLAPRAQGPNQLALCLPANEQRHIHRQPSTLILLLDQPFPQSTDCGVTHARLQHPARDLMLRVCRRSRPGPLRAASQRDRCDDVPCCLQALGISFDRGDARIRRIILIYLGLRIPASRLRPGQGGKFKSISLKATRR